MLLRPAVSEKYVTPSSLRSRSFQNEIQCSAYFLVVGEQRPRRALALSRGAIREESLQLLGRRQQAPHVEIDAAREQRVGDGRRLRDLAARQVGRDESIERRLPFAQTVAGIGGARKRERSFPGLRRRRATSGVARAP